ncbi:type VII secretion system-associated protein [Kitasatospora sp. NPDC093806]|uniref:type VII secretion system-associated protein n=1 Tax=Kitasatospora sp. NPDC093806 TaxID=3155075 RepID=UPI0034169F61
MTVPTAPVAPPITPEMRAEARRRPGSMLYAVDPAFDPAGTVPPHGIIGGYQVDHSGAIARFVHNPNYRPSPQARGWTRPENALEAALQLAAAGYGDEGRLAEALGEAEVLVLAMPGTSEFYVQTDGEGRLVLDACTSAGYLPEEWPGSVTVSCRQLAEAGSGLHLRLNPGSVPSVTLPLDAVPLAAG